MFRIILLIALIAGVLFVIDWLRRTPAHKAKPMLRKALIWGAIGLLVLAVATGRLNPVFAALAAAVPLVMRALHLLRMLPMIQQILRSLGLNGPLGGTGGAFGTAGSGRTSAIRTRFLDMELEHDSGRMDGTVIDGPFLGRRLSDLELDQLARMMELYRSADPQSASVLDAYLDRERGDEWQARDAGAAEQPATGAAGSPMTEDEAWAVLGLEPGADEEAVRSAHRRLMQKLHPDRGGSDYLAAKINEAKRLLEEQKR